MLNQNNLHHPDVIRLSSYASDGKYLEREGVVRPNAYLLEDRESDQTVLRIVGGQDRQLRANRDTTEELSLAAHVDRAFRHDA